MNKKQLVRFSNAIGLVSIVLLVYWVFTFITIQVFGLKVFRENLTEIFYMSVLGILALMAGALIINVMLNMTRIAGRHNEEVSEKKPGRLIWGLLGGFPVLLMFLFFGDHQTSRNKEKLLIKSAKSVVENKLGEHLLNYSFSEEWIDKTSEVLDVLGRTDTHFPSVSVIVSDTIADVPVYLGFRDLYNYVVMTDSLVINKKDYIHSTTAEERVYLEEVFQGKTDGHRYSSHDGNYELFYPYSNGEKLVVIYFSDYQRYGKIGS